jgi:hypothetical protein
VGDSLGIDVGAAAVAAARRCGARIEPVPLGPSAPTATAADLVGAAGGLAEMLAAVAGRALRGGVADAVAVAGDGAVAAAARATFARPVLVPRAVAAAAWWVREDGPEIEHLLAVVEAEASGGVVSVVGCWPDRFDMVGAGAADLEDVVGLLASVVAGAGLAVTGLDAVVVVGSAPGLAQVAADLAGATGVRVVVDAQPELAVALGAALLAGDDRRRLPLAVAAAGSAGLAPLPFLAGTAGPTALPGAGVGGAVGEGTAGTGVGARVGAAAGAAKADPHPHGLRGPTAGKGAPGGPGLRGPTAGKGAPGGPGPGAVKAHPPAAARRCPKHRLVHPIAVVPAILGVTMLLAGAVALRSCGDGGDPAGVVTADPAADGPGGGADPATAPGRGGATAGKGAPTDPSPTTAPASTIAPGRPADPAAGTDPGAPTAPGGDPAPPPGDPGPTDTTPPAIAGLARSQGNISEATGSQCPYPFATVVSATVTDDVGVAAVTVSWTAGVHSGGGPMSAPNGVWQATIGPITEGKMTVDEVVPLTWTVTAVDGAGNRQTATSGGRSAVALHGCLPGAIG